MSHAKSFTFSTAIKKQKRLSKESNIYAVEKELHGRPKNYGFKSTRAKIQQRQHNQLINGK